MTLPDEAVRRFRQFLEPQAEIPKLGKYLLRREIARGGMGIVYEAEDPELQRRVALKVLKEGDAGQEEVSRLHREAAIAAQLQHPNIVGIHEVTMVRGPAGEPVHFIVMDYVQGRTFADLLRDPAVPRDDRLRMLEDVARAVAYAHSRGVIHRDLKPANVLVDPTGRVVLTDFGLARSESFRTQLTSARTVMGTPNYMAPEQIEARTHEFGPATDVYALGVMLYETLVGRAPFSAQTPAQLYYLVLHEEPPRPRGVERELEVICLKAMEKHFAHRYANALAFAEDLARFRRGDPILAQPPSLLYRLRKKLARRKALVAVSAIACVAVIALSAVLIPKLRSESKKKKEAEERARISQERALTHLRQRSRDNLAAALALRRAGNLEELRRFGATTESVCREAMEVLPTRPEPHHELGRMYRALMRDDDALVEQENALARDPNYAPARYERIVLLARRYRRRLAELVEQAWREEGTSVPSRRALSEKDPEASRLRGRLEADLKSLRSAPIGAGELACAEGLLAWVTGALDLARERFAAAVERSSTLEEAYEALATLELEQGCFEDSVQWWSQGLKVDQGYLPYWAGRARAWVEWGKHERALEDYGEALKKDDRSDLWLGRGLARMAWAIAQERKDEDPTALYQAAIEDVNEALKREPASDASLMSRGLVRLNWGGYKQSKSEDPTALYQAAVDDLTKAILRNPKRDGAWMTRGLTRLNWGEYKRIRGEDPTILYRSAVADFDEARRLHPGRVRTWLSRALAHRNWGEHLGEKAHYEEAIRSFEEALKLDPADETTWVQVGSTRMDWAHLEEDPEPLFERAIDDFGKAIALRLDGWDSRRMRADALATWGQHRQEQGENPEDPYRRAEEDYGELLKRAADLALHRNRGRVRSQRAQYRHSLRRDPTEAYEGAIADFGAVVEKEPRDAETWVHLGSARVNLGTWSRSANLFAEAVGDFGRALAIDPSNATIRAFRLHAMGQWGIAQVVRGFDGCREILGIL